MWFKDISKNFKGFSRRFQEYLKENLTFNLTLSSSGVSRKYKCVLRNFVCCLNLQTSENIFENGWVEQPAPKFLKATLIELIGVFIIV